jgi:hypothetical protein
VVEFLTTDGTDNTDGFPARFLISVIRVIRGSERI